MKIALVFPGQGAQYIGMCKSLLANYSVARQIFLEANDALGFNLTNLIQNGEIGALTRLDNGQPAVIAASQAFYSVLVQETGLIPSIGLGHSLGEISALIAAGGISFEQGIRFSLLRGQVMYRAVTEGKGRVGVVLDLSKDQIERLVDETNHSAGFVAVSCYNSAKQFVVSCEPKAVKSFEKAVRQQKGEFIPFKMMPMKVDAPFHSSLMAFLESEIKEAIGNINVHPLAWPVLSSVTGIEYPSERSIPGNLAVQLTRPVLWSQCISYLKSNNINFAIEVGPQSSMKHLIKENSLAIQSYSFDDVDDQKKILSFLINCRFL